MALRCVYTDLDGTLLGRCGSLFRDAEGNFSMLQARALEACHRAEVEVVIKSGRREPQVLEDARLIGSTAYIYEAGCAVMIDGEETVLIGDFSAEEGRTVYETIVDRGVPELLFESSRRRSSTTPPGTPQRQHSHLFRGKIDVAEANAILEREGHGALKLIDNGAIVRQMDGVEGRAHAYHLMPAAASKANAVVFHMRARGYAPEECIAIGDSVEDLRGRRGRRPLLRPAPTAPSATRACARRSAAYSNVTVTEGAMGDGVYEAIVSTLAARRPEPQHPFTRLRRSGLSPGRREVRYAVRERFQSEGGRCRSRLSPRIACAAR